MKKPFGIVLALLLTLSVILSGCGGDKNNESKASSSPTASPAESSASPSASESAAAPEKLDPYKLVMVYPGGTPKDLKLVQDEMSKYLTEKINATIELKPIDWGAWGDKTGLMFTSNEKFDLIFTAAWNGYNTNVAKGQFLELDQLLEQYGQGAKTTLGEDWIKGSQVNGHNYGLPTLKEFAGAAGILFRKDLVDKYAIDLNSIRSLADLTPIFQLIKDKEPGVTPLVQSQSLNLPGLMTGYSLDYLGDSYGVLDPDNGELKVVNLYETKKYTDAVYQMREWNLAGFVNKDASTIKDDQLYNIMKAGKGFSFAVSTKPGKDAEMTTQLGVDLIQKDLIKPQTTTGEATGAMLAISRTSDNSERSMMFLDLLYTDQYLINLLNFGIEGQHFVKDANNVLDYPEGVTSQTSGYNPGMAWMFGNQFNTYLWSNEDPDKWNKFKEFNDGSTKSPALGFVWDPANVKNEVSAVGNAKTEFGGAIQTGTIDPDKFLPQFIQKMNDAGLDKIIVEKQRQLDDWAKNK